VLFPTQNLRSNAWPGHFTVALTVKFELCA
jgi:hypothetical protein